MLYLDVYHVGFKLSTAETQVTTPPSVSTFSILRVNPGAPLRYRGRPSRPEVSPLLT